MGLENFIKNNKAWKEEMLKDDPGYFDELAKGQTPTTLLIGCSDSRVSPSTVLGSQLGEIFIHRNIANQAKLDDPNFQAILDYCLNVLKVENIIVKGHYGCGGVAAAAHAHGQTGKVYEWVEPVTEILEHHPELDHAEEHEKLRKLVELNTLAQLDNIRQTECYKKRMESGHPVNLYAWVFDINTGGIVELQDDPQKVGAEAANM
ncbi:MAG TPA: carbonic anhydrase [Phnomibacter sp.]|nr:carbonic anhydrase [Phnomibacter sp.]